MTISRRHFNLHKKHNIDGVLQHETSLKAGQESWDGAPTWPSHSLQCIEIIRHKTNMIHGIVIATLIFILEHAND